MTPCPCRRRLFLGRPSMGPTRALVGLRLSTWTRTSPGNTTRAAPGRTCRLSIGAGSSRCRRTGSGEGLRPCGSTLWPDAENGLSSRRRFERLGALLLSRVGLNVSWVPEARFWRQADAAEPRACRKPARRGARPGPQPWWQLRSRAARPMRRVRRLCPVRHRPRRRRPLCRSPPVRPTRRTSASCRASSFVAATSGSMATGSAAPRASRSSGGGRRSTNFEALRERRRRRKWRSKARGVAP